MKKFGFLLFAIFTCALNALTPPILEILDLFGVAEENVQELWMQKGKERWEFDKRYEYMRPVAWPLFEKAGLVSEVPPQRTRYNTALVFGALLKAVERRVSYLESLWNQGVRFDQFVFLTGQRPLLETEKAMSGGTMETDMVRWVYSRSTLPKDVPVVFIDAPRKMKEGIWVRPDTKDTIAEWLKTNPKMRYLLAVSNQPYVEYQNAVLGSLIPKGFKAETVGPAVQGEPTVALFLDTIAKQILFDSQLSTSAAPVR